MRRNHVTFLCLSSVLSVIVCLQLINHFVILTKCLNSGKESLRSQDVSSAGTDGGLDENILIMLDILGKMKELHSTSLGDDYEQLMEILHSIKRRRELNKSKRKDMENVNTAKSGETQEICPEVFLGESLSYGYPFFRKGFATLNCSEFVPIDELVTLVFHNVFTMQLTPPSYERVLRGVHQYYPRINVIFITTITLRGINNMKSHVKVIKVLKDWKQGRVWSEALAHVTTKYVLIAKNLVDFNDDVNLHRMTRILSHNPNVAIVSGAYRERNGHWDMGCEQSQLLNYTLTRKGGYFMSAWDCVMCDYTPGPWMARTKDLQLDVNLNFGVFYDMFLRIKKEKRIVVSCADVMFNVHNMEEKDSGYLDFVNKHDIKKIVESNGRVRWFGCKRDIAHRHGVSCPRPRGLAVSPCDLENLADAIKMIMSECEKNGIFCELQEGTLLGAVKFNKVLPWERDADLTFLTANYTALKSLASVFRSAGHSFTAHDNSVWCCVDNRKAGGRFTISADGWNIELYGQHLMDSEILVARGEKPTKVDFAGQRVTVVRNPGLFVRNRYGNMLYRHQEHWMENGMRSGWNFYNPQKFHDCPKDKHSACLNQYSSDGNMQFDINTCPCVSPMQ